MMRKKMMTMMVMKRLEMSVNEDLFYTCSIYSWVSYCFSFSLEQKSKKVAGGEGQQGERPAECKQQ